MGAERVLRHELVRNPKGEVVIETTGDIDLCELLSLGRRIIFKFSSLPREVGLLGVGL
jgi:hypothetical protein